MTEANKKELLFLLKMFCVERGDTCAGCPMQYFDRNGSRVFCMAEVIKDRLYGKEAEK